jgi:hypothetical protein
MLKVGDTFLLPPRPDVAEHLWIVLTRPDAKGEGICVNITSEDEDHTTELTVGDHPFVKHPSVVRYRNASSMNLQKIEDVIQGKLQLVGMVCKGHHPSSAALLERVKEGLLKSPHTLKKFKLRCAAEWGVEWPPKKPKV